MTTRHWCVVFVALRASSAKMCTKILAADFVAKISDPAMRASARAVPGRVKQNQEGTRHSPSPGARARPFCRSGFTGCRASTDPKGSPSPTASSRVYADFRIVDRRRTLVSADVSACDPRFRPSRSISIRHVASGQPLIRVQEYTRRRVPLARTPLSVGRTRRSCYAAEYHQPQRITCEVVIGGSC